MPENSLRRTDWRPILLKAITWLVRLTVGATFLVSGFVKAVDPWGTLYKFEEYMAAMGLPVLHNLLVTAVFGLCALEFLIGVFIVLGCYRRSAPIMTMAFMCVMLPLTLWIAVKNPVSDCGCFGEFLVLSNWATFWKNVALTALAIWLLKFNKRCITIISPAFQWIGAVISFIFILSVSITGYNVQPLLDFRPYPAGAQLVQESEDAEEENYVFVYEKDGIAREFGIDDELPDEEDGWKFVERREAVNSGKKGSGADDRTFRIWDKNGDADVTDEVLEDAGRLYMLLIPDMASVSPATSWKINALYRWAESQGALMVAVVSGSSQQIADWEDLSLPEYDIFTADDTAIKEVARGNPAVVALNDGRIEWKSTLGALDADESEGVLQFKPSEIVTDPKDNLAEMLAIYIIFMAFPLALTFMPRIKNAFGRMVKKRRAGRPDKDAENTTDLADKRNS